MLTFPEPKKDQNRAFPVCALMEVFLVDGRK